MAAGARLLPLCLLALAACGRPEAPAEERGIFVRDVPEGPAPIDPAPDLADIRPVPDLYADQKALALLCNAKGDLNADGCACVARAADSALSGRSLAYFAAILIDDQAEAARLRGGLLVEQRTETVAVTEQILRECGAS